MRVEEVQVVESLARALSLAFYSVCSVRMCLLGLCWLLLWLQRLLPQALAEKKGPWRPLLGAARAKTHRRLIF
jgi:hypothetical protein